MRFRTFSSIYWSFKYLLLWSTCSELFAHYYWIDTFSYLFEGVSYLFWIWILCPEMYYNYLLPLCVFLFTLWRHILTNKIYWPSQSPIYVFFIYGVFVVLWNKSFPTLNSERYSPKFSSKRFINRPLTCWICDPLGIDFLCLTWARGQDELFSIWKSN